MNNPTALLLIDVQVNMFADDCPVFEGEKLLRTIDYLITQARTARLLVIYMQNNGGPGDPDQTGTAGWEIHPLVAPEAGDILIQKHTPDSFYQTNLQSILEERHIHQLIVAGMQTEMCIDATCRRAHELGYDVTLVKDGHSTFDDGNVTAPQIIAQSNEALLEFIKVEKARSISFS